MAVSVVVIIDLVELVIISRNMIDLVVVITRNLCENTAMDVDLGFPKHLVAGRCSHLREERAYTVL